MSNYMNDCPEPTLTCSEVVERLRQCVATFRHPSGEQALTYATFDTEKATAILHSWRERRVQELERAVKIASCQLAQGSNMDFSDANIQRWQEEAQRIEQQLLIEAREALARHPVPPHSADSGRGEESSSGAKEIR